MALSRAKYKRLPDLYVTGKEVELKDGEVMWMQILNPFELDEARHDAQVARARLVMALQKHGSDEMNFVDSALWQDGIEGARNKLVEAKAAPQIVKVVDSVRNDPEWTERLEIMDRTADDDRLEGAELALLSDIQRDYVDEVTKRMDDETEFIRLQFADADEATLREEYAKLYIDRRGGELAQQEFRVTELWYAARVCEGVKAEDETWSHERCEGHVLQAFETKGDVRMLPEDLTVLLGAAYDAANMSARDAKNSDRLASSSASSRQPSAPEASTPSTPDETP